MSARILREIFITTFSYPVKLRLFYVKILSKFKEVEVENNKFTKKVLDEWLVVTLWKKGLLEMWERKQIDLKNFSKVSQNF